MPRPAPPADDATLAPAAAPPWYAGDVLWRWGAELDPGLQLRRARGLLTGKRGRRALRAAVEGRRILITGASAGIGRETALQLAPGAPELLLVARRRERLEALADELAERGAVAHVLPCDLSDLDAVDALADHVVEAFDGVDVLINNAGHSIRRTVSRSTERLHDYERVMRLNYFAPVHLTLPLLEPMRRRRRGHIVNVSTMGTQVGPEPRFSAYLGSKGALEAFARSAAAETAHDGIRWTTVHLPLVRTDMIAPTRAFAQVPALSVPRGAAMVVDGVVRAPARVSHPLGVAASAFELVAPRQLERLMGQARGPSGKHRPPRP